MKVEKFLPSPILKPFVKEYMIVECDLETDSSTIPDTSIVLAFRFMGRVQKIEGGGKTIIPATSISGIRKSLRTFYYSKMAANLLVILKEGGIAAFSRIPAHELFGLNISSDNLFPSAALNETLERLSKAGSNNDRVNTIEAFLLGNLVNEEADSNLLISKAIQIIRQQKGIVRIKDLANALYISQDPFEKKFRALIGSSPKQYASIIRLRSLIKNYPSYASLTEASYEAGYFDQSHFIKDFRVFTGQTPKDFFKSPVHM